MCNHPLIVMACGATKLNTAQPVPLTRLYTGPLWQQLRKHGYPTNKVAVLSAEHGIVEPDTALATYDRLMDEERLLDFINNPVQMRTFADMIKAHGKVVVVGGELYKLFALAVVGMFPELIGAIHFALGSYLQQRAALNTLLQAL